MIGMEIIDKILGNSERNKNQDVSKGRQQSREYKEVELMNSAATGSTQPSASHTVQTIKIEKNTDTLNAKDQLRAGNIVIADLRAIKGESGSINVDRVIGELNSVVEDTNGDMAYQDREQAHIILTPESVDISRERL